MKKTLNLLLFIFISTLSLSCNSNGDDYNEEGISSDTTFNLRVDFEYGEDAPSGLKNIYVIWIEDTTSGFLQNIFICQKLISGGLTGTALPYWKSNKYPDSSGSEIDAVTAATQASTDFSVSAVLKDPSAKNFILYLEMDRYSEPNDWFTDQPALLYSVNINVDDDIAEYELLPTGWTPHEAAVNVVPNTPFGKLQKEMRYITNHKEGTTFGDADERSATRMIKRLTATIEKSVATNTFTASAENLSILLFPNPSNNQISIKSNELIEEVTILNMQSQPILFIQPKTCETSIVLNRTLAPKGTYFARIKTLKGISTHKILLSE